MPTNDDQNTATGVLSVSELNRQVGRLLSARFTQIWVRGEVSNFTQAASGHWYFSIKDERATVRAVMFRNKAQWVGFTPKAGERFEFRATVTLYEPRGDYQLQVDALRRAGLGDLHEAFMRLKAKLQAEGLFDEARKRPIPTMPKRVGVITSLAAAALRDVITALSRRAPHVEVIVYPAPVQGMDAAGRLTEVLRLAIARNEVDTLLLVRGGGSLEDLWSFNDEALARAIASSPIPIIAGVGHETDFSIADFVADLRAPTPTAAAELCCRSLVSCEGQLNAAWNALNAQQARSLERASLRLDRAVAMLVSPQQRVRQRQQALDHLAARLDRAGVSLSDRLQQQLYNLHARLLRCAPRTDTQRSDLTRATQQLAQCAMRRLDLSKRRLHSARQTLEALNPHGILERGYAIVRRGDGTIVKNALDLSVGEQLGIELDRGSVRADVVQVHGLL